MFAERMGRRALGKLAGSLALTMAHRAAASPRARVGGRIALRLPWPQAQIDPHRGDDALAAIVGPSLFDTLYTSDRDVLTPVLAEGLPEARAGRLRVALRAGMRWSNGKPIEPNDVLASLARARTLDAKSWLADVAVDKVEDSAITFRTTDKERLTAALSSPLTAIVPLGFSPDKPEGTGALRARRHDSGWILERNVYAPEGPSLVDAIVVRAASTLADSPRAFESGADDLGWLGSGLYTPRPQSVAFDFGPVGFVVIRTGKEAASWDMPGVAQRVADGIPQAKLTSFALGPAWTTDGERGWGGPQTTMLVRDDAPYLMELADTLSALLSRPTNEVRAERVHPAELSHRRNARTFGLMLDLVRPHGAGPVAMLAALGADESIVRRPPKFGQVAPRTLTRTLRTGILGQLRVQGSRMPWVHLAAQRGVGGIDWGASTRTEKG